MKRFAKLTAMMTALVLCCLSGSVHAEAPSSPFHATFLQGWLCRDWTQDRWNEEFRAMDEAGFDAVILQTVCDLTYEQTDASADKQDSDAYALTSAYMLYPSSLPELEGAYVSSQNGGDALALALSAAEANGVQIWIGTCGDNRWWNYGWGAPLANAAGTSYFSLWCEENAALCGDIITEVWNRYGGDYADQIAGFYYVNEVWNIDAACAGTDGGAYAACIGENINGTLSAINTSCPDKPLMISPFFNPDLSTAAQYGAFWKDIFTAADFRPGDIFAHQDGGGRQCTPEVIREWAVALRDACLTESGMQFWINHETFQTDSTPKPIEHLAAAREATADLTGSCILFSWNHYYNPLANADLAPYGEAFLAYVQSLQQSIAGDLNLDGSCDAADISLLQAHLLGNAALTAAQAEAADLSADGIVDVFDLGLLKKMM